MKKLINIPSNDESSMDEEISILFFILDSWPDKFLFPILDISRLVVLNERFNAQFCKDEIMNKLLLHLKSDALPPNQMLTFRLLANLFNCETGFKFSLKLSHRILPMINQFTGIQGSNNEVRF